MPGDEANPKTRKPVEDGTGPELQPIGVAHFLRRYEPDQVRGFEAHLSATIAHPGRVGFYAYLNEWGVSVVQPCWSLSIEVNPVGAGTRYELFNQNQRFASSLTRQG
jgi:hypothetical protein